jgi:hypothetical protein
MEIKDRNDVLGSQFSPRKWGGIMRVVGLGLSVTGITHGTGHSFDGSTRSMIALFHDRG